MSKIDRLIEHYIAGGRGEWYYIFHFGDTEVVSGGNFYHKKDARVHFKRMLRTLITDDYLLMEYLTFKVAADEA